MFSFFFCVSRLLLAALHYNENADRGYVVKADGTPATKVRWPKYKKGEFSVLRKKAPPKFSKSKKKETKKSIIGKVCVGYSLAISIT